MASASSIGTCTEEVLERLGKTNIPPCCETFDGFQQRFTSAHVQSHGASDIETLKEHVCLPALWVVASSWTRCHFRKRRRNRLPGHNVEQNGIGRLPWQQLVPVADPGLPLPTLLPSSVDGSARTQTPGQSTSGPPNPPSRTRPTRCAPCRRWGTQSLYLSTVKCLFAKYCFHWPRQHPPLCPEIRPPIFLLDRRSWAEAVGFFGHDPEKQ